MPNIITDLVLDRVDLVEEGANSAAFIELYKGKERNKPMTIEEIINALEDEHAQVIKSKLAEGDTAIADLAKAKEDLDAAEQAKIKAEEELAKAQEKLPCECDGADDGNGLCASCGRKKLQATQKASFDETEVMKSLPPEARHAYEVMKAKVEAAESAARQAAAENAEKEAIEKAAQLKNIPVAKEKLISVVKAASPEVMEILTAVNAAIDVTVLEEVGKSATGNQQFAKTADDAWGKIEAEAATIAKAKGISQPQAIAEVIKTQPKLYKDYLQGGAN